MFRKPFGIRVGAQHFANDLALEHQTTADRMWETNEDYRLEDENFAYTKTLLENTAAYYDAQTLDQLGCVRVWGRD